MIWISDVQKILCIIDNFFFTFQKKKVYSSAGSVPLFPHLTYAPFKYKSLIILQLSSVTLACRDSSYSKFQISCPFPLHKSFQRISTRASFFVTFWNTFFRVRSCLLLAWPQTWGPPFGGCLHLLVHYIYGFPPYLVAILIHSIRMHHVLESGTHLIWS